MQRVNFVKNEDIFEKVTELFESEKRKLSKLFPSADIQHIGSTAVSGTISKGDLDINIRVKPDEFAQNTDKLKTFYKINQPENWTKNFASFKDDSRQLGIQVTVFDSPEDNFVKQRDYLRSQPRMVTELNALKKRFEGGDMDEYRKTKGEFFDRLNSYLSNSRE